MLHQLSEYAYDPHTDDVPGGKARSSRALVNEAFLRGQSKAVAGKIDALPIGHDFIGLRKRFDDASVYMSLPSSYRHAEMCRRLDIPVSFLRGVKNNKHRYTVSILNQRQSMDLGTGQGAFPIYLPGKIMPDKKSTTIFNSLEGAFPPTSTSGLAKMQQDHAVVLFFMKDG